MDGRDGLQPRLTEEQVRADLQRQPHLLTQLAENALLVADSLRDNYFKNTARFVTALRRAVDEGARGARAEPPLSIARVGGFDWDAVQDEVVTFIDGGFGQIQMASRAPILLRVGSYSVRVGERRLAEREQFGYYPVVLGDLEGGSKERENFPDMVRIIAELLGGLAALESAPDLRALFFHGPLVQVMKGYPGHMPFTERDVDLFLRQYVLDPAWGRQLKEEFLHEARIEVYPRMTARSDEWAERRLFEPLAWIAFLYRRLIRVARSRRPAPIVAGVIERGRIREFSEKVLLERVFRGLRQKGNARYFNEIFARGDLTSPRALLDRLGYSDPLLLAMILQPGEAGTGRVSFGPLRPGQFGLPRVLGCYVCVSEKTEPIRVEVFADLGGDQLPGAACRAFLYSRLLPGYGFPVGLDVADKHAHVPAWMIDAYSKLIRHHLGVSLQQGAIGDAEMRRILVQSIYMTHRDWLFRPQN
jgi:hypothetical protein